MSCFFGAGSHIPSDDDFSGQQFDPKFSGDAPAYVSGVGFGSDRVEISSLDPAPNEPILPSPSEMQLEDGFALKEWRRQNAIQLEEKRKKEKAMMNQIVDEADEVKTEFYRKRQINCEANWATNREKQKLFLASNEKLYAEADKNYWKTIAELIPNEVPKVERKGKKGQEKSSIAVVQGPKPGKPTELSRMRQILLKLKHSTPEHLKFSLPTAPTTANDAKAVSGTRVAAALTTPTEPLLVA